MEVSFELNLDSTFADAIRQQHQGVDGQRFITDLEDQIGSAIQQVYKRYHVLPSVGDRVQIEPTLTVVISARSFESDGTIWLAVQRYEA